MKNNQNHIVQSLQDHETRLSRGKRHVKSLENQLKKLKVVIVGQVKQNAVFAEVSTSTTLARILSDHISQVQRGLYQLNVNKLDPSLITYSAAKKVLENITKIAVKKGYTLGINAPVDLFQVETGFLANGHDIYIFTSVPLVKNDDVIDLYYYQSSPLQLSNSSSHLIIKPEQEIIAVANDRSTFETFSQAQLNSCKKLHDAFYCTGRSIQKKENNQNCLYSLFTKSQENIKKSCEIRAVAPREFMMQVGRGQFYIFTPRPQRLYVSCNDEKQSILLDGFKVLNMPDGCKASTEQHVIQTSWREMAKFDIETKALNMEN